MLALGRETTMPYKIVTLTEKQFKDIDTRLADYDNNVGIEVKDDIQIGTFHDGKLIAGAGAGTSDFRKIYVYTLFVDEEFRGKGIGRQLMEAIENEALSLGANMIRLNTYNSQSLGFYVKMGYEQFGSYENEEDGYTEYFFIKKLYKR